MQNDELLNVVRIGVDSVGKRYIGVAAVGGRSVHVLDEELKTLLSFSPNKRSNASAAAPKNEEVVADFHLVDIHGIGIPILLLGLLSLDGTNPTATDSLRAVDLQNRELWRDETIVSPFQVGTYSKDGRLEVLAVHTRQRQGTLLRFDAQGKQLGELAVEGDRQIRWFRCADISGNGNSETAAILVSPTDESAQVSGLGETGAILWSVPIPSGEHLTPIEQLGVGDITGDGNGEWIVPTVDGSILFIDRSGKLIDSFAAGRTLSGVAVLSWDNHRLLVVADSEAVTAWSVE